METASICGVAFIVWIGVGVITGSFVVKKPRNWRDSGMLVDILPLFGPLNLLFLRREKR